MKSLGKFTRVIAIVMLAGGSAVWADAPATQPAQGGQSQQEASQQGAQSGGNASTRPTREQTRNPRRGNQRVPRRNLFWMLGGSATAATVRPATAEEWSAMMDFLSTNSPSRWSVLSSLNRPNTDQVKLEAIRRWRNYVFYRQNFPEVADQMVQRFHLEDDLFAITLSAQEHPADLDEFRDKIHNKVDQMVQVDFAERQLRIEKLEKLLESQKAKLAQDEQVEDQTVDERTNGIMKRLERLNGVAPSGATTKPDGDDNSTDQPAASGQHDAILNVTGGTDSGGK